jgi:hypothetical protein
VTVWCVTTITSTYKSCVAIIAPLVWTVGVDALTMADAAASAAAETSLRGSSMEGVPE